MTRTFLRITGSVMFALRRRDITEKENPSRLGIKVYGKAAYKVAMTAKYAPVLYKHLLNRIHPDHKPDDYTG